MERNDLKQKFREEAFDFIGDESRTTSRSPSIDFLRSPQGMHWLEKLDEKTVFQLLLEVEDRIDKARSVADRIETDFNIFR